MSRYPFSPYPDGWYAVAWSDDLPAGGVVSRKFCGDDVVLFRGAGGEACLMGAYCPHLGAHMGHGGRVEGDDLRCPFHGFCFSTDGACTKTGYGTPPPRTARARVWPVQERNGVVLAWHGAEAPSWEVPTFERTGWSRIFRHTWPALRSHPQETSENSVDIGHFGVVHGYRDVQTLQDAEADGPLLTARYAMTRHAGFLGRATGDVRVQFGVRVHGLGYSQVETWVEAYGLRAMHYVLPTPLDGDRIELRAGITIAPLADPGSVAPGFGLLPAAARFEVLGRAMLSGYVGDIEQDFAIWENKIYVHPPLLAQGDGPVTRYRRWARQFYPSAA